MQPHRSGMDRTRSTNKILCFFIACAALRALFGVICDVFLFTFTFARELHTRVGRVTSHHGEGGTRLAAMTAFITEIQTCAPTFHAASSTHAMHTPCTCPSSTSGLVGVGPCHSRFACQHRRAPQARPLPIPHRDAATYTQHKLQRTHNTEDPTEQARVSEHRAVSLRSAPTTDQRERGENARDPGRVHHSLEPITGVLQQVHIAGASGTIATT